MNSDWINHVASHQALIYGRIMRDRIMQFI